jgi:hypothetical protein
VALWELGFVRVSVRACSWGCGSGSSLTENIPSLAYLTVKLRPLPQPHLRMRTYAQKYPSTQRATQLESVLALVYPVSRQNLNIFNTTTIP